MQSVFHDEVGVCIQVYMHRSTSANIHFQPRDNSIQDTLHYQVLGMVSRSTWIGLLTSNFRTLKQKYPPAERTSSALRVTFEPHSLHVSMHTVRVAMMLAGGESYRRSNFSVGFQHNLENEMRLSRLHMQHIGPDDFKKSALSPLLASGGG